MDNILIRIWFFRTKFTKKHVVNISTYKLDSDTLMLGKYNENGKSYIIEGYENGDSFFNIDAKVWSEIAKLPEDEVWKINKEEIDRAVEADKDIEFVLFIF
ncbi:MAG: hypothetical protein ACK5HR_07470 [Mycoplasmatales bacterium]